MPDLADGESTKVKGSGSSVYELKNVGGVYSCSCPAWRNQSAPIEKRSCKHLRALRGAEAEEARVGAAAPRAKPAREGEEGGQEGPPVLLAQRFEGDVDPKGWWMSEKLDGVRAYWDGKQFLSRLGNAYLAPDWFIAGLPEVPLDGELWLDRKAFQRTVSIVRRSDKSDEWRKLSYVVFDAPAHGGAFEERVEYLRELLGKRALPYARFHPHQLCQGLEHLRAELEKVEALGGEGLMLRSPRSKYEVGRSSTLLKVKTFHDAEARVVDYAAGEGRHKGRVGALVVEAADGTRFSVGTGLSDEERRNPPPVGSVITYRFQELSDGGVPRFPSYVGVRIDAEMPPAAPPKKSAVPAPAERPASTAPAPAVPAHAPGIATSAGRRRFEFVDGSSAKFWEIEVDGSRFVTSWGRLGARGQQKEKSFASPQIAQAAAAKLVSEKVAEGYRETSAAS